MPNRNRLLFGLGIIAGVLGVVLFQRRLKDARRSRTILATDAKLGTALITGASSGIGEAFARRLAAAGFDLILVARREARLVALATELQERYTIQAEVLGADLASPADVSRVEQRLAEIGTLSMLINNAGYGMPGYLLESDLDKLLDMIHVHVIASVRLSYAALPGMVARRRGAIINVSSVAAFFPTPGASIYSATKASLNVFSEALQTELFGTGVQVQALCPGFTRTEFHHTPAYRGSSHSRLPKFLWLTAEEVVTESLSTLGRGQVICIPGLWYQLIVSLIRIPPISRLLREILSRQQAWLKWNMYHRSRS